MHNDKNVIRSCVETESKSALKWKYSYFKMTIFFKSNKTLNKLTMTILITPPTPPPLTHLHIRSVTWEKVITSTSTIASNTISTTIYNYTAARCVENTPHLHNQVW